MAPLLLGLKTCPRRINAVFWLLFVCLYFAGCSSEPYLRDTQNNRLTLASLYGQWVLINYWAIWCKPCIEEIQELNQIDAERQDIAVLGFNFDQPEIVELTRQVKTLDIRFRVMLDNPATLLPVDRLLPAVLPTTLILNPQGELVKSLFGPQTKEGLAAEIERLKRAL